MAKHILDLPNEMLLEIFKSIPANDLLLNVGPVSRRFEDLAAAASPESVHIMTHTSLLRLHTFENPHFFDLYTGQPIIVRAQLEEPLYRKSFTPLIDLHTPEQVAEFVKRYPNITSLTISGSYEEDSPPTIIQLIDSYPQLIRLECSGKFDLVESLRKLKHLQHFAHVHNHNVTASYHRPRLDELYMREVPEVMHRLVSLKLDSWENKEYLPAQLKEVRIRQYDEPLYRRPEHYKKIAALEERIGSKDSYATVLERLSNCVNLKSIHLLFGQLKGKRQTLDFFVRLFQLVSKLPKLESIFLESPNQYYQEDNTPDQNIRDLLNWRPDIVLKYKNVKSPFVGLKHLQIIGIELPFQVASLQRHFPDAQIDYHPRSLKRSSP